MKNKVTALKVVSWLIGAAGLALSAVLSKYETEEAVAAYLDKKKEI